MQRKEFLKSTCKLGICSCAGMALFSGVDLFAETTGTKNQESDWRIGFMQKRFAKLLETIDLHVDKDVKLKILENLGRECAKENRDWIIKFKGNPKGFLDEIKGQWAENIEYNEETSTARIIGKKKDTCGCPFVDNSITPKEFCCCSIGWNKEAYETVLGKSVDVEIEQSVLRGGERCIFLIKVV